MNKQSKYVRLADQLLRILKHCRVPLYLHRKSNHIYIVWQHIVLVTLRQYEGKSYRMFTDWLVEAYYLRLFLQLSKIPHYTTLQKFTDRINIMTLGKIISSFIVFTNTRHIFAGIDATGFKITHASEYYTNTSKSRRKKYAKLSIGADVLQQIVCFIKIRRAPTRHDNIDFGPIVTKISKIKPLSVVVADKGYDSEDNHVLVRENLNGFSIMPPRYEEVSVWKTHGKYRNEMKRGYNKILYNQRNKDETIVSVIKRLFGEHITSRLRRMQNRELTFRCIAYNVHRMLHLIIIRWFLQSPTIRRF
ncbi:MAG: IS5 family transposase [Nitrososphaeraceae archaeon]